MCVACLDFFAQCQVFLRTNTQTSTIHQPSNINTKQCKSECILLGVDSAASTSRERMDDFSLVYFDRARAREREKSIVKIKNLSYC